MRIKIWDGAIRLFHWALVIAFCLAAFSAFQDKYGIYADMHTYAGISVLVLVAWRILWGFVGSDTARFSQFVKGPRAILAYLKGGAWSGVGHNPLGSLSVLLMLLLLLVQAVMGLFATDDMFFEGPLAAKAGDMAGKITGWHELTGYTLMGLIGLHILVVLWYAIARKIEIILPMITGSKQFKDSVASPRIRSQLLALLLLVGVAGSVWYLVLA